MTKNNYLKLQSLLTEFQNEYCICYTDGKFTGCKGYQNCEFRINGCYGESCAFDDIIEAMNYSYNQK